MHLLWMGIYHGVAMFWETLWALVLGFGVSAALQVFVSKEKMSQLFGRTNLKTMLLATGFGAASSSCSYAAVAAGRSAFQQGAALIPALAFMFASTNLVVELGAVLWVLMGWHFVLAEVIGAFVLIGLMWLLMSIFFPKNLEEEARRRAEAATEECAHHHHVHVLVDVVASLYFCFCQCLPMIFVHSTMIYIVLQDQHPHPHQRHLQAS